MRFIIALITVAGLSVAKVNALADSEPSSGAQVQFAVEINDGQTTGGSAANTFRSLRHSVAQVVAQFQAPGAVGETFEKAKSYVKSTNAAPIIKMATAEAIAKLPDDVRQKLEQLGNEVLQVDWAQLPDDLKSWIQQHPYQTAFYVVNGVVFIAPGLLSAPVLTAMGWARVGPRLGSAAPALQSLLGPVRAKSLFATLQSAQMGGYGRATVAAGTRVGNIALSAANGLWQGLGKKTETGHKRKEEERQEKGS